MTMPIFTRSDDEQITQLIKRVAELEATIGKWEKKEALIFALYIAEQQLREQRDVTIERLCKFLKRYRAEVPVGHQPHMICAEVDEALDLYSRLRGDLWVNKMTSYGVP